MKKIFSLLKAIMSQDMDLFKIKAKTNSKKSNKMILPLIIALLFMCVMGMYFDMLAQELEKLNLMYVMLSISLILPVILTVVEGIYKVQGILFESKDTDMLFSLPIKKSTIIFSRLIKLFVFQYMYNLIFILPAIVVYARHSKVGVSFYALSLMMSILLPIIPTIIASFIGLLVKNIAVKFRAKRLVQTIFTMILFFIIGYIYLNANNFVSKIIANAKNINEIITKVYYPIGAYVSLLQKFSLLKFINWLLINILPLVLFVAVASKLYFNIISKSKNSSTKQNLKKEMRFKQNSKLKALITKELRRYFSSTVYVFNTAVGLVFMFLITVYMCINIDGAMQSIIESGKLPVNVEQIGAYVPKIYMALIIFTACLTSITSSSISMEKKSFNITKSMPVSSKKLMSAKILTSNIIVIPVMFLCDILFLVFFKVTIFDVFSIIYLTCIMPTLVAIFGLLANLKYPKMDAFSDTEAVKQSASTMVSVFGGMLFAIFLILITIKLSMNIGVNLSQGIIIAFLTVLTILLWIILKKYAEKRIIEI